MILDFSVRKEGRIMNYWIRCSNCGKVEKYPYPGDVAGDIEANLIVTKTVEMDGWIFSHNREFCCKECELECVEHYEKTGNWLNLPAVYRFQQNLKGKVDELILLLNAQNVVT